MRVAAAGLNFADLLMVSGKYQAIPPLPCTLGLEYAGTVDAVGAGVDMAPGTRVAVYAGSGGLAEYAVAPVDRAVGLPDRMGFETAAGFLIAYGTSHTALVDKAGLQAGETLLVLGAAGGVGLTAVELGARLGARVIAVVRGADKQAVARDAGAAVVLDAACDLKAEVKALGGADVVYDPVGGDAFTAAFGACRRGARIVVIGFASGSVAPIPANIAMVKNISILGHHWGGYLDYAPERLFDSLSTLMDMYAEGGLSPVIGHRFPLEDTEAGWALLRSRKATGKVVISLENPPASQSSA